MISKNRAGFTLMELLVYMAIVGIVVVVAGEAFSNSTKFRIRTDNMIKATQEAENVAMLFKADVEQIGSKSSKEDGNAAGGSAYGDNFGDVHASVYIDPNNANDAMKDSSSFLLTQDGTFSNLKFRRLRYDELGRYEAIEEVNWYVENGSLKRACKLLEKKSSLIVGPGDPCGDVGNDPRSVEMATQVTKFNVLAATPSAMEDEVQIFPATGNEFKLVSRPSDDKYARFTIKNTAGYENVGGTGAVFSDFFSNYDNVNETVRDPLNQRANQAFVIKDETTTETNWRTLCSIYGRLSFEERQEYEISFDVLYPGTVSNRSLLFVPGTDHMSVGFRSIATGDFPKDAEDKKLIDDFMFFPPLAASGSGKRVMRFRVRQPVSNVCMAFTFASYSPLVAQGTVTIKNLKLKKVASADYQFPSDPDAPGFNTEANKAEKKNVKALKLVFQVSRGAKNGGKGETGDVSLVIPIPSNGSRD